MEFRYGHGRHTEAADGLMAYEASGVDAEGLFARLQDLLGFRVRSAERNRVSHLDY